MGVKMYKKGLTTIFVIVLIILILLTGTGVYTQGDGDVNLIYELIPNSPYSYINDSGKLEINITPENPLYDGGVAPDSIHVIDSLFSVKNVNNSSGVYEFTVSVQEAGVLLYSPGDISHSSSNTASNIITFILSPGEEANIGMVIDTSEYSAGDLIEDIVSISVTQPT
jgi:hypothetical protein